MEPSWHGFGGRNRPHSSPEPGQLPLIAWIRKCAAFLLSNYPLSRRPIPEHHAEVDLNFFFHQMPPPHAALWHSRSEPVNALRCASMNAQKNARH
jgi:hypothetical protein